MRKYLMLFFIAFTVMGAVILSKYAGSKVSDAIREDRIEAPAFNIVYSNDTMHVYNSNDGECIGEYKWEVGQSKADSIINKFELENR